MQKEKIKIHAPPCINYVFRAYVNNTTRKFSFRLLFILQRINYKFSSSNALK